MTVLWIDRAQIRIYSSSDEKVRDGSVILTAQQDRPAANGAAEWADLAKQLKEADRVVLLGPDMSHFHFRFYLQEQEPQIFRRVAGSRTVGPLLPEEVALLSRRVLGVA